jgi:hypothetical protein
LKISGEYRAATPNIRLIITYNTCAASNCASGGTPRENNHVASGVIAFDQKLVGPRQQPAGALAVFCVAAAVTYGMSAIGQADALDAWWLRARFSAHEAKDITPDGKRIAGALIRFGIKGLVRNELKGASGNIFGGSLSGALGNVLGGSVGGALGNGLGGRGGGRPRLPF